MGRTLSTLAASILLSLGWVVSPLGPAHATSAATEAVVARTAVGHPPAREADKPTRDLHDKIVKRHGRLYFKGRVDPGHGPVVVEKKACSSSKCPWRRYASVSTRGPEERWQVRVYAPKRGNWYWRGYVKASGGYAKSWTHVYKTYVTRP